MANLSLGHLYYFDTNGAINNSKPVKVKKIALWCNASNSEMTISITGSPVVKLVRQDTSSLPGWEEIDFGGEGWWLEHGSVVTVTAGSGYVYIA